MKTNHKFFIVILMTVTMLFFVNQPNPSLASSDNTVYLKGGHLIDDRTLVPLRSIFEELGATVVWDQTTRTVTAYKAGKTVRLTIDSRHTSVNGNHVIIDVPAQIKNDRTLVPLRFVSEAMGGSVDWNSDLGIATILSGNKKIEVTIEQIVWLRNPVTFRDEAGNWANFLNLTQAKIVKVTENITGSVNLTVEVNGKEYTRSYLSQYHVNGRLKHTFGSGRYFFTTNPYNLYYFPESTWNDIRHERVRIGMSEGAVWLSLGLADRKNRSVGSWGVSEQWVYEQGTGYNNLYLYFDNGILTSWQN
ncbi:copper amine oxidase N-terminal domain-containing protein [Anaerobacillus sp. MEB173]|uniref:copper amine oxidase N-terminal domain-containing protein n=1 Tax=Anaerobacillus sp. MEB173 TaxID=3383345 RepID=UPI003F9242EB